MNRKRFVHLLLVQPGPSHYYLLPWIIAITFWLYPLAFGLFYLSSLLSTQWPVWTFKNHLSYNIVLFKTLQWLLKSFRGKKKKNLQRRPVQEKEKVPKPLPTTIFLMSLPTTVLPESIAGEWSSLNWSKTLDSVCLHQFIIELPRSLCKTNLPQPYFFKSMSFALYFPTSLVTMWKRKSLSHVQLWDPMDCIVHGILQARVLEWVAFLFSRGSSQPSDQTQVSHLQADSLPAEPQGKPKNTGVGSLSFLQAFFPTQELNQGLLYCRQILYQLNYEGSSYYLLIAYLFINLS